MSEKEEQAVAAGISTDEAACLIRQTAGAGFDALIDRAGKARRAAQGDEIGLGETPEQRVELADALRLLQVDAVPINFLDPRPGTPLAGVSLLRPEECLVTIAVFRLMLPGVEIIVMGGREVQLGQFQRRIFHAGASATIVGDYLTTQGCGPVAIGEMIHTQGLRPRSFTPDGHQQR